VKSHSRRKVSRFGGDRGQTLIEFAIILPFLLALLLGFIAFGFAFYYQTVLTNSVNDAAQVLMVGQGQITDPCASANNAIASAATALQKPANDLNYTVTAYNAAGTAVTLISKTAVAFPTVASACSGDGGDLVQYQQVVVSAAYNYTLNLFGYAWPIALTSTTSEAVQ
jgi:Flp pilus assembly protein TadG